MALVLHEYMAKRGISPNKNILKDPVLWGATPTVDAKECLPMSGARSWRGENWKDEVFEFKARSDRGFSSEMRRERRGLEHVSTWRKF